MVALLISPLAAQEKTTFPRHYLSLSVGEPWLNIVYSSWGGGRTFQPVDGWFMPELYNKTKIELPAFSLTYFYSINSWLMVGAEVYYWGGYVRVHERITDEYIATAGVTGLSLHQRSDSNTSTAKTGDYIPEYPREYLSILTEKANYTMTIFSKIISDQQCNSLPSESALETESTEQPKRA